MSRFINAFGKALVANPNDIGDNRIVRTENNARGFERCAEFGLLGPRFEFNLLSGDLSSVIEGIKRLRASSLTASTLQSLAPFTGSTMLMGGGMFEEGAIHLSLCLQSTICFIRSHTSLIHNRKILRVCEVNAKSVEPAIIPLDNLFGCIEQISLSCNL